MDRIGRARSAAWPNLIVRRGIAVNQTNHFFNLGYGWLCKHCSAEEAERRQQHPGEKQPIYSAPALAQWADPNRQSLSCPRCGVAEQISSPTFGRVK
ncbi:MAG TPA: hypothetical protein VIV66_10900 [Pyrinomonadaceae bacterium]